MLRRVWQQTVIPQRLSDRHQIREVPHDIEQNETAAKAIYSWDGRYLGWDPDPNIRFQIMRDQNLPKD